MANEDYSTLPVRKLLIAIARSCIGAHYLRGGNGEVPLPSVGKSEAALHMLPHKDETVMLKSGPVEWGTYFTAKNSHRVCSGKHEHPDVVKMPKGDPKNPAHLSNPDIYRWQRVVKFNNINPLRGESCEGKLHFDCVGFIRWCVRQVNPNFRQAYKNDPSIAGIRKLLTDVNPKGVNKDDLCAGDILIRNENGHIGFAAGDGQRVVQAEWEQSGVVETDLGKWEYHGRLSKEYWVNLPALGEYEEIYTSR
jgi:hypothetical protein